MLMNVFGENLFCFDKNSLLEDIFSLDYPESHDSVQYFDNDYAYGRNHMNSGKQHMLLQQFMKKKIEPRGKFVDPKIVYLDPFRTFAPSVDIQKLEGPTSNKSDDSMDDQAKNNANVVEVRPSPSDYRGTASHFSGPEPLWNERGLLLDRTPKNLDDYSDRNEEERLSLKYSHTANTAPIVNKDDDYSWIGASDEGYDVDMEDVEDKKSKKRKFSDACLSEVEIPDGFKLPASKSPIMEAMSYCAINKWGIEIHECKDDSDGSPASVIFKITDFEVYYRYSSTICSKQNPTEDIGSRVKSLRRWFTNFPKKRERKDNPQFLLEVKPDVAKKVYSMIEKYKCLVNVKKRRRLK